MRMVSFSLRVDYRALLNVLLNLLCGIIMARSKSEVRRTVDHVIGLIKPGTAAVMVHYRGHDKNARRRFHLRGPTSSTSTPFASGSTVVCTALKTNHRIVHSRGTDNIDLRSLALLR